MNSESGRNDKIEEEKVDKTLRRLKPIPRREKNLASPNESLESDSENDEE